MTKDLPAGFETLKARVRARVKHPFHLVKNLFRHRKVRYRGLARNTAQLQVLFALANLVITQRALLPRPGPESGTGTRAHGSQSRFRAPRAPAGPSPGPPRRTQPALFSVSLERRHPAAQVHQAVLGKMTPKKS